MSDDTYENQLIASAADDYRGSAWRARFLRAPKIAIPLAERSDFVPLSKLATCKLGLKTGADSFFFLERRSDKVEKDLLTTKGVFHARGFGGWEGELAKSDVLPAILNPHQMTDGERRFFTVPAVTKFVYLYPSGGRLKRSLLEYVRLGELAGLHQKALVESNAEDGRWYKQVRGLVRSEWVLPYNSAYDYSAWRNPHRAVLNGRFVGVDPLAGVDTRLLGACLNSSFAVIGRLVEGVATGVEGAFDVGPPAARRIMLPDIMRFSEAGKDGVLEVYEQLIAENRTLPAPAADGSVPALRRKLDLALLVALGMTPGQSAVVLDRMYAGYGRWKSNLQGVEEQMRGFRRQMKATGQSRDIRPVDSAGKRVWEEIEHLIAVLPRDVLPSGDTLQVVNIPASAVISKARSLFDEGVIWAGSKRIDLGSYDRVRYVAMLRTMGVIGTIDVPVSPVRAGAIVDLFEKEMAQLTKLAAENALKYVSVGGTQVEIVDNVVRHWLSTCRKSVLIRDSPDRTVGGRN